MCIRREGVAAKAGNFKSSQYITAQTSSPEGRLQLYFTSRVIVWTGGRAVHYSFTQTSLWFVIKTKPRAEPLVLTHLARDPIIPYAPKVLAPRRHGSRRWQALESLFPGYLFARFIPQPSLLHRIRRTPGVVRLLWDNESLVPVDDDVVQFIRQREEGRGFIEPSSLIQAGARVRFGNGPFAMLEGVVDRLASSGDRVRVLLTLMGAPVSVDVGSQMLEIC